ncbi:hypothetical protein BW21_6354 (plasmid) [Burkholderia humptydooensis]|uniref:Wadjet anti-phage system protein JetD domain-containing protein n=1 Tax=Burkholderia humptydooensis TaxID=430531 RepID=UPI0005D79DCB|nr:Wadjet anti-phage system protein JetD domain-containing protein [Burkholderia humptydooensis]AJY38069.1 hypothetical protein BW21_6354 [Burkholderia sp. 2002721687]
MNGEENIVGVLRKLMAGRDSLQPRGLIERISDASGISPIAVKLALGKLSRQGAIRGVSSHGEAIGRVSLTMAKPNPELPESHIRWDHALRSSGLTDGEVSALVPCHDRLAGFSDTDLVALTQGLLTLRAQQVAERGVPAFVRSARYLLGSSKLLGSLPAAALRAFGIEIDSFPDAPSYLLVAGPEVPEAVLLIENPHSFEEALASGCASSVALVATYGYGLSRFGEAYGNALIETVSASAGQIPLVRAGNPPAPGVLLNHSRIRFWGDLDREGLRIYGSLRARIPALRASAIYWSMCAIANDGRSHPYTKATAKERQGNIDGVPSDAERLIPFCLERGVDQEAVCREDILRLSRFSIDEVELP